MDLRSAIDEYLRSLATERGLATNTIAAYRRDLRSYASYLTDERDDPDPVDADDVAGFVASLGEQGLARSTVARKLAAVRGLHRFMVGEGLATTNPTRRVDAPRRPPSLPKALTVDEMLALVEVPEPTTPLGRRDRALLEFMYATAARVGETIGVRLEDVDLDERTVVLSGKGGHERMVPIGGHAVAAIQAYLPDRLVLRRAGADPGTLFLNRRGGKLTRQGVWVILRRHGRAAGIDPGRLSPHVIRHSTATHMVEGGADLRTVQELLGHASISTTQVYTRVSPRHLLEVYVTSHPRSRTPRMTRRSEDRP